MSKSIERQRPAILHPQKQFGGASSSFFQSSKLLNKIGSGSLCEMSYQKALCLICELPTADGAVSAVQVDKEKLQTWFLNVCEYELAEEIYDDDLICYFCLWHAEFQWKLEEMVDENLIWWPRNSEHLDDAAKELRKKYFEGKLEQCWVQLEIIELPRSKKKSTRRTSTRNQRNEKNSSAAFVERNLRDQKTTTLMFAMFTKSFL
ncbi:Hypothetical predicted protein [Cloeon dipterum]|uniref:Uncharacterized protein n=1 Tax=Cloeon dipterum TaxID=197152 RepID=A0A8S1DF05_9INSE|nr:Hypothetical predicted protein [Cloeon dipterum]